MDILAGWAIFGVCILINCAMYWGIDMAFENDFWRDDARKK
jgi:hypothetical protein|tara:strand:- start:558 stop:680 length:123 start_codon:yes stop_codon:yes gene_type:complete